MSINGKTKIFALAGSNISHSYSPFIQNFLIQYFKLDSIYIPMQISSNLSSLLKLLRVTDNFCGVNITLPYKEEAYRLSDILDEKSQKIRAVNTIRSDNGKLTATNTDIDGFLFSLSNELNFSHRGKNIVVLGSGGTCKTVVNSLLGEVSKITIISRRIDNIADIVSSNPSVIFWKKIDDISENLILEDADIIINATPIGVKGESFNIKWESLLKTCCIFDIIYLNTPLIRVSEKLGFRSINGLGMLVYQAIKSFEFWNGINVDNSLFFEIKREVAPNG